MKKNIWDILSIALLVVLFLVFITPIFFVLINSFKGRLYISDNPFALPTGEMYAGFSNFIEGIERTDFFVAFFISLFITVLSVAAIVLFTAMTAWYLVRVKTKYTSLLYFSFVFSMIVPFQMIMFTMSKMADMLSLNNPLGMVVLYLDFGAGLSVFMLCGFIKAIPLEVEEASMIDGCTPIKTFFKVVFPMLKPTAITVAILNAMWI